MPATETTKPTAVPVRDLKDTARFCRTVRESDGPIVVTRNGYDEFFVLTPDLFHEFVMMRRRQELYNEVDAAEARLASGQGVSARDALAQIRRHHGV
ncbi:MAG: hypothetical protein Q4A01_09205 [Coriobacteriales bacterium]|nr:hypothetical protein [Coriobacteriales bacterium]